MSISLGVNIDHIATLRNARGEGDPSLLEIAFEVQKAGADIITMHLREDRRHIIDSDLFEIKKHLKLPINFEMALTEEMLEIALKLQPATVCLVPEKREEITTEGGLDVQKYFTEIKRFCKILLDNNIQPFLFIEANNDIVLLSKEAGATGVEIHTGKLAHSFYNRMLFNIELDNFNTIAKLCDKNNIILHAGHGLNYQNISYITNIINLKEVNIGHAIISKALSVGMYEAVFTMKNLLR